MTARHEKPSPSQSSTDGLIKSLNMMADMFDRESNGVYSVFLVEAALRLDKLERDIEKLKHSASAASYSINDVLVNISNAQCKFSGCVDEIKKMRLALQQLRGEK